MIDDDINGRVEELEKENKRLALQVEIISGAYETSRKRVVYLEAENEMIQAEQTGLRELISEMKMKIVDLEADNAEMLDLAKMILRAEAEAHGGEYGAGLFDCKDNDGKHYQSAYLAGVISKFAALVDKVEVNPNPADLDEF